MKTIKELTNQAGVSVRTLHHYDKIGLLKPAKVTEAGYRLYDEETLDKLYLILIFREIGFPLKDIQGILDAPDYDRNRVLEQQIRLLEQKKQHIQNLIHFTSGIKMMGVKYLEFDGFDARKLSKLDDYAAQAKTLYGKSEAYQEYVQKANRRTKEQNQNINSQVMDFFVRLGTLKDQSPGSDPVQNWVKDLQAFFTEHYYNCTPQILIGLSEMYAGGGSMNENIDAAGGKGTGAFAREAIVLYCRK